MAKSEAFARIKDQVLRIVATIPESKVTTYQSVGEHLAVMPRHVAYILSQLDDSTKLDLPWYRVVSADGSLGVPNAIPTATARPSCRSGKGSAWWTTRSGHCWRPCWSRLRSWPTESPDRCVVADTGVA